MINIFKFKKDFLYKSIKNGNVVIFDNINEIRLTVFEN